MASKKGICPYCNYRASIVSRIFPVNAEATVCYCPNCMRKLAPIKAIENYNNIVSRLLEKADKTLFVACDPVKAYRQYADVLEVEGDNYRALLGRILCLIYTSKVRKEYLSDANELLEGISHKGIDQTNNYVQALKTINFALEEYDTALTNRLIYKEHFYDEDCMKLYLAHLYDIIEFKKDILEKLKYIRKNYTTQDNSEVIKLLEEDIEKKDHSLHGDKFTVDGVGYSFVKVKGDKAIIEKNNEISNARFNKRHLKTLKEGVKGKKTIKDVVFKDYTPIIKMRNISIPFLILLLIGTITCGVFAYLQYSQKMNFILFLIAGAICFAAALVLFVFILIWSNVLRKRKMRIDQ